MFMLSFALTASAYGWKIPQFMLKFQTKSITTNKEANVPVCIHIHNIAHKVPWLCVLNATSFMTYSPIIPPTAPQEAAIAFTVKDEEPGQVTRC